MSLRAARRAVALVLSLCSCVARLALLRLRGPLTLEQRAAWVHRSCRHVAASLSIRCVVEGAPPAQGILVANHLSYLDIVVLNAATPCFFVAKAEISRWFFFGQVGTIGGTLYVQRSSRNSAAKVADQIAERLQLKVPVLIFPEGTTTDGSEVLRFHARLFEPAITAQAPVTAASIRYVPSDGSAESEYCWFGDAQFIPHLWKVLGAADFTACVRFGEPKTYPDRKSAAEAKRDEIVHFRQTPPAALD